MTEKIQSAINKIDSEAEKMKDTTSTLIASHIIDTYLTSDENAEKVLDEKKSLNKCIDNIKSKAKQQATNGMAMIDSEVVYGWVKDYFGFAVDCKGSKVIDLFDFI